MLVNTCIIIKIHGQNRSHQTNAATLQVNRATRETTNFKAKYVNKMFDLTKLNIDNSQ
jgi:hypothetical protein